MKLTYETMLEAVEVVYTTTPTYRATNTDPAGRGDIELKAVWLMTEPGGTRVVDILPLLKPGMLEAMFGKNIYEHLADHAADCIADEQAAAEEYRAEMRRD
jgi:hypothetical protein